MIYTNSRTENRKQIEQRGKDREEERERKKDRVETMANDIFHDRISNVWPIESSNKIVQTNDRYKRNSAHTEKEQKNERKL